MFKDYRVSIHRHYFSICLDHVSEYERICSEMERHAHSGDEPHIVEMNLSALYERREKAVIIPVVFAAMCLEAFIYDYGAQHLGDGYVKDNLDKLDMASKFMIISRLSTGNDFPKEGQAFEGLKRLAKDRNKLVHFKSKRFSMVDLAKASEYHEKLNIELKEAMYKAINTVRSVMREMDAIHSRGTYYERDIEPYQCHA